MKRQKFGGRQQGTPNARNVEMRDAMREYLINEFEYLQSRLNEMSIEDRCALFRSLVRYGIAPLAPQIEVSEGNTPIIIVSSDL